MLSYLWNKLFKKDIIDPLDRQGMIKKILDLPINDSVIKYDHYLEGKLGNFCSEDKINCMNVLPNGYIIASFEDKYELKLNSNLKEWISLFFPSDRVMDITPLSDDLIVIFLNNNVSEIWNIQTKKLVSTLSIKSRNYTYLLLSDGRMAYSYHMKIHIWNLITHKYDIILKHPIKLNILIDIKEYPGGKLLSLSADGTLCCWNLNSEKCLSTIRITFNSNGIFLLPDGRILIGMNILMFNNGKLSLIKCLDYTRQYTAVISDNLVIYCNSGKLWIRNIISDSSYSIGQWTGVIEKILVLLDGRILVYGLTNFSIYNLETKKCDLTIDENKTIYDIKLLFNGRLLIRGISLKILK